MSFVNVVLVLAFFHPYLISAYNTNRQIVLVENDDNCDYYDNPVFQTLPSLVQSRMGDLYTVKPVGFITNRVQKDSETYDHPNNFNPDLSFLLGSKYIPRAPLALFPNVAPASSGELSSFRQIEEEDEDAIKLNYDKLWKVGEMPPPVQSTITLPDVYVRPEDAPPKIDMVNVEQSELTAETHDLEDVEIEEKYLNAPSTQVKEVFIEKVKVRPDIPITESPAIVKFRKMDADGIKKQQQQQKQQQSKEIEKVQEEREEIKTENVEKIVEEITKVTTTTVPTVTTTIGIGEGTDKVVFKDDVEKKNDSLLL